MEYRHAVLKTINGTLKVEVNENEEPKPYLEITPQFALNNWKNSCKYLDFASEDELRSLFKYFISKKLTNSVDDMMQNNINISSIITIKDDLVYFKGNEESQDKYPLTKNEIKELVNDITKPMLDEIERLKKQVKRLENKASLRTIRG